MQKSEQEINSNQIQITFNSKEDYRILTPILNQIPYKLYYFIANIKNTGQKDEHLDFFIKNTTFLKEKIPNLTIVQIKIDYTDYIEIVQELSKIIKREREENPLCEIFINIGTGSKITAIASTEAARLWNCKVLYVYSTKYNPFIEGARHKGEMIIKYPPIFPAQKPMKKLIKVLKIIDKAIKHKYRNKESKSIREFVFKKALLELLIENGLLKLVAKHNNLRFRKASYYMKLNQRFLNPLANKLKYIEISTDKRNKKIFLTETGKNVLKIFKYLT